MHACIFILLQIRQINAEFEESLLNALNECHRHINTRIPKKMTAHLGSMQTGRANDKMTASLLYKIFDATRPV